MNNQYWGDIMLLIKWDMAGVTSLATERFRCLVGQRRFRIMLDSRKIPVIY